MSHEKFDMYQYGLLSAIALHGLGYLPAGIYWMLERRLLRKPHMVWAPAA